jgi:hypothetical protein
VPIAKPPLPIDDDAQVYVVGSRWRTTVHRAIASDHDYPLCGHQDAYTLFIGKYGSVPYVVMRGRVVLCRKCWRDRD